MPDGSAIDSTRPPAVCAAEYSRCYAQLQSAGLGAIVHTRNNQMTYHKPLPTADNKHDVEKILAPNHMWDEPLQQLLR